MWKIFDSHELISVYTLLFVGPFLLAYLVLRLRSWWSNGL